MFIVSIITFLTYEGDFGSTQTEAAKQENRSKQLQPRGSRRDRADSLDKERLERGSNDKNTQSAEVTFSSTVHIEIAAGETLVTGGYQKANGQYELIFLTPSAISQKDGSQDIKLASRAISVDPSFITANKLGTLTTRKRNSLQHAEAWNQQKLKRLLKAAAEQENSSVLSSPTSIAKPGTPTNLILDKAGETRYSINASINHTATGGFGVNATVERTLFPNNDSPTE